jgi:hypothetical protein
VDRRSSKISTALPIAAQYAALAALQEERLHVLRAGSYQLDAVYLDAYGVASTFCARFIRKQMGLTTCMEKTVYYFKRKQL